MSDEMKYEFNTYAKELNKDLMNLMNCLIKQDKDNKAIFYVGKHIQKIILPVEEYQKMQQQLQEVKHINLNEPLECLKRLRDDINAYNNYRQDFEDLTIIKDYILKIKEVLKNE